MIKAITYLVSTVAATVNENYQAHLNGKIQIEKEDIVKMYEQFDAEFDSPHKGHKFAEERMSIFAANV